MDMSSGGVAFALSHATLEGKITIGVLLVFSLVSWTVIINKFRQLAKAKQRNGTFLDLYSKAKSPLVIFSKGPIKQLQGSPMYELYFGGCEELKVQQEKYGTDKIPNHGISAVRIALERVLGEAAVGLESGMIVLATAISGGPFIGLLGTVWGSWTPLPVSARPSRPPSRPWRLASPRRLSQRSRASWSRSPRSFATTFW